MSNRIIGRYGMGMRSCCDSVAGVGIKHIDGCEFARYPEKSIHGALGPRPIGLTMPKTPIVHRTKNVE